MGIGHPSSIIFPVVPLNTAIFHAVAQVGQTTSPNHAGIAHQSLISFPVTQSNNAMWSATALAGQTTSQAHTATIASLTAFSVGICVSTHGVHTVVVTFLFEVLISLFVLLNTAISSSSIPVSFIAVTSVVFAIFVSAYVLVAF